MKKDKSDKRFNKGARTYLKTAVKAASHPVRNKILKNLKKGSLSTPDLEAITGEDRYNLYHHLDVLIKSDLINEIRSEGRSKQYDLKVPKDPDAAVFILDRDDLGKDPKIWIDILDRLERIEGEKIPNRHRIIQAEIHLRYR